MCICACIYSIYMLYMIYIYDICAIYAIYVRLTYVIHTYSVTISLNTSKLNPPMKSLDEFGGNFCYLFWGSTEQKLESHVL